MKAVRATPAAHAIVADQSRRPAIPVELAAETRGERQAVDHQEGIGHGGARQRGHDPRDFALMAFGGAVTVPSGSAEAQVQTRGAPRGSYAQSCSGSYVNQGRLYADCRDRRGNMRETSIELARCSSSDIGNDNGLLVCYNHRGDYENNGRPGGNNGGSWGGGNNGGGRGNSCCSDIGCGNGDSFDVGGIDNDSDRQW